MNGHPEPPDGAETLGNFLRFPQDRSIPPRGVHISIDSNATTIGFDFVAHAGPVSRLSVESNGTRLTVRFASVPERSDGDGGPAHDAFVTEWSSAMADGHQAS